MFDYNFFSSHIFDILTEFDEKVVEELPVEVLAHLVEDEPVSDGAVGDVAADQIQVLTSLEVPDCKFFTKYFITYSTQKYIYIKRIYNLILFLLNIY